MKVSRGDFLALCGSAILGSRVNASPLLGAVVAGPIAPVSAGRSVGGFRLQDVCAAQFRPHVNSTFSMRPALGSRLALVLASVSEQPINDDIHQFSLIFHGPAAAALPDGIHTVQHPALGDFDLFVVPVGGPNAHFTVYEACFSRHVEATEDMPCR